MEENQEMTFWDHLEEFRWTLVRSIIALFVFAIGSFACMRYLFDEIIMAPTRADFFLYKYMCFVSSHMPYFPDFCNETFKVDIVNIKLTSMFFVHLSTSFWLALILTFPYLVYEIWKFISPALYDTEKKNIRWAFIFGTGMFFIGCIVGYYLVFPMTFRFLADYDLSEAIIKQVSLDSYMDNFLMMIFIMGIVFEMPLLSWLLSEMGFLNKSFFKQYRRHAIVALLVAAAFITPSGDPFTLAVVFGPLYILYEISCFFVKPAPKNDDDESEEKLLEENSAIE